MSKPRRSGPINFTQEFGEAVAASQRVWGHDRSQSLGSSEAFGCIRQAYFEKREPQSEDVDADDSEWGHKERGNIVENHFAVPVMRKVFGDDVCHYMGDQQQTFVDGQLSCTPDGIVVDQGRDVLAHLYVPDIKSSEFAVEVKTFVPSTAPRKYVNGGEVFYEAKPQHVGQTNVQLGIFHKMTNFRPEYSVVLYINPAKLSDIRPAVVQRDPAMYVKAQARAADVFDLTKKAKDYKAEGVLMGTCQYCKYTTACALAEASRNPGKASKPVNDEAITQIEAVVLKYIDAKKRQKEIDSEVDILKEDLKDVLYGHDTMRASTDAWSVSIAMQAGRKTLSKSLLMEDGIDVEKYMTEGAPFPRISAKLK